MLPNSLHHDTQRRHHIMLPIATRDSRWRDLVSLVDVARIAAMSVLLASAGSAAAAHGVPAPADDACALADKPPSGALVHVPFDTVDGRIYVQAQVNGQGPFRFAVDTGASGMARADASLVASLGLTATGEARSSDGVKQAKVETTHLDSLELGGFIRRKLDVIARDYNSRNSPEGSFAGIIAREYFSDGLLIIDYPRKTLSFTRTQRLAANGDNVLQYERAFRIPVSIGTLETIGQLDTGADVAFVLPESVYDTMSQQPLQRAGHAQLTNGRIDSARAMVHGPFRIGQLTLSDMEIRVSAQFPEVLIGAGALQDSVVLIDQRSSSVAVCRNSRPTSRTGADGTPSAP